MDDDKGPAGSSARASSSADPPPPAAPPPPPPPSNPPKEAPPLPEAAAPAAASQRQRFSVELRPDETTIVSWKKLIKGSSKGGGAPVADPTRIVLALPSDAGPLAAVQPAEEDIKDEVPPPNRFNAVIEKIERLYMGKQSSDEEELGDIPDEDQYDTEDSFIDDAELDEYFQVDKLTTKHDGYYINRGKLERIEPSSTSNQAPKRRRRKDSAKIHSEKDHTCIPAEPASMSNMKIKAAARNAPLEGKKSSSSKILTAYGEHHPEGKHFKNKLYAPGTYKKKSSDFTANLENPLPMKVSQKDAPSVPLESKVLDKHKAGAVPSRDLAHRSRGTNELFDDPYQGSRGVSSQVEAQPKKLLDGENNTEVSTKMRRKDKNGIGELPDLNSSVNIYPLQTAQPSRMRVKEGTHVRPKGTTLERAIRDLEKIVAESRPPYLDVQEVDTSSQAMKRRLPQDIKQKLAKVARLSENQGKLSDDKFIERLMGILGHLVQRKTLKRNMKEMVELGLSAKQQKADRFQHVKKEVNEMIRAHVSHMKSKVAEEKAGSADDFQEVISNDGRKLKGKQSMDKALEDKICDLYDLYMEGIDEDKGPQSRKLYVQLADLWPNGYMDNLGIKYAIYRSKERKRALQRRHEVRDEERMKRKRMASSVRVEETSIGAQVRAVQERAAIGFTSQVTVSQDKLISNQPPASSVRLPDTSAPVSDSGHHHSSKLYDRARSSSGASAAPEDGSRIVVNDAKKKIHKRKPESDVEEFYGFPQKPPAQQGKERSKSLKQNDEPCMASVPHSSLQPPAHPGSNHPI